VSNDSEEHQEDAPCRAARAVAALDALWTTHVADSAVSRNTRLHNLAFEAKETLKTFLARLDDME